MTETTEKTIADELREAAARLREQGARAREATKTGHGDEWLPWEVGTAHARDITNPAAPAAPTGGAFVDHPAYRHDRTEAWYESRFLTSEVPAPVAEWMTLAHPGLAEPLARWLEDTATVITSFKVPTHPLHEPCDDPVCYTAHPALTVARVLNGTPQEVPGV